MFRGQHWTCSLRSDERWSRKFKSTLVLLIKVSPPAVCFVTRWPLQGCESDTTNSPVAFWPVAVPYSLSLSLSLLLSLSSWLKLFYKLLFVTFLYVFPNGKTKCVGLYKWPAFGRFWAGIMVKLLSISNEKVLQRGLCRLLLCRLGVSVMPGQQPICWNKQPEG